MTAGNEAGTIARRAVVCRCVWTRRVDPAAAEAVAAALRAAGWTVQLVDDLCEATAHAAEWWVKWLREGRGLICACRPRAIRALVAHVVNGATAEVEGVDLVGADAAEALQRVGLTAVPAAGTCENHAAGEPAGGWLPWFPVIDPARCVDCGQCVEFCLFGVYELRDGHVKVVRPENCKPHCPACARICPEVAIVFPKHNEPPLEGAEIADEAAARARARQQQLELAGKAGDLRAVLTERRRRASLASTREPGKGEAS